MKMQNALVTFCVVLFAASTGCASSQYPVSDHYNGERFFNPDRRGEKSFWTVLKWHFTTKNAVWPKAVPNKGVPQLVDRASGTESRITFITHASFLIQTSGVNILTDPIYSERCSPVSFAGPKRIRQPGVAFDQLPKIDVVVISHNHYEHMDKETIRRLSERDNPLFLVPLANAHLVKDFGAKKVIEMDWWHEHEFSPQVKITLTPAQHWSARGLFDRFEALWGGFFISAENEKVFFAGDTGYGNHFKEIEQRLGAPTLSLLPIGAYEPRWFMSENHVNPEEAVLAHIDLKSKLSLGMHFGTYQLTSEPWGQPLDDLATARRKHKVAEKDFYTLEFGETLILVKP